MVRAVEIESAHRDGRRAAIHAAAIARFSAHGYAATSMAQIAAAAGISRPALYQYFDNKDDVFASAFVALFDAHVDRALEAFGQPVSLSARLDLLLQRFDGDLWERLAASPYADEITSAKSDEVNAAVCPSSADSPAALLNSSHSSRQAVRSTPNRFATAGYSCCCSPPRASSLTGRLLRRFGGA